MATVTSYELNMCQKQLSDTNKNTSEKTGISNERLVQIANNILAEVYKASDLSDADFADWLKGDAGIKEEELNIIAPWLARN